VLWTHCANWQEKDAYSNIDLWRVKNERNTDDRTYCIPVTTSEGFRTVEERDVLATVRFSLNLKM